MVAALFPSPSLTSSASARRLAASSTRRRPPIPRRMPAQVGDRVLALHGRGRSRGRPSGPPRPECTPPRRGGAAGEHLHVSRAAEERLHHAGLADPRSPRSVTRWARSRTLARSKVSPRSASSRRRFTRCRDRRVGAPANDRGGQVPCAVDPLGLHRPHLAEDHAVAHQAASVDARRGPPGSAACWMRAPMLTRPRSRCCGPSPYPPPPARVDPTRTLTGIDSPRRDRAARPGPPISSPARTPRSASSSWSRGPNTRAAASPMKPSARPPGGTVGHHPVGRQYLAEALRIEPGREARRSPRGRRTPPCHPALGWAPRPRGTAVRAEVGSGRQRAPQRGQGSVSPVVLMICTGLPSGSRNVANRANPRPRRRTGRTTPRCSSNQRCRRDRPRGRPRRRRRQRVRRPGNARRIGPAARPLVAVTTDQVRPRTSR